MIKISLIDFTNEAASMGKGKKLKSILEPLLLREEEIVIDFNDMTRFASPFFNNSFSALAIAYGFDVIDRIVLENISEIGKETYDSSMANARLLVDNPKYRDEIHDIVSTAPKKVEC